MFLLLYSGSRTIATAEAMYFPPSFAVYRIIGSFVTSTSFTTVSWHPPLLTISGVIGFSIASDSLPSNCFLSISSALAIRSFEETSPAATCILDSCIFSKSMGFSSIASMIPAISYSVETSLLILVNSPLFSSCSRKLLKSKVSISYLVYLEISSQIFSTPIIVRRTS